MPYPLLFSLRQRQKGKQSKRSKLRPFPLGYLLLCLASQGTRQAKQALTFFITPKAYFVAPTYYVPSLSLWATFFITPCEAGQKGKRSKHSKRSNPNVFSIFFLQPFRAFLATTIQKGGRSNRKGKGLLRYPYGPKGKGPLLTFCLTSAIPSLCLKK